MKTLWEIKHGTVAPIGNDESIAYDETMKRWKSAYDGYQGTAHEQGWPDQRTQTLRGGGELNFDVPPGRYPIVCQSTRGIKPPKEGE